MQDDNIKITFVPGCFDDFDGTQEELDQLIVHIQEMANSGELFKDSLESIPGGIHPSDRVIIEDMQERAHVIRKLH